MAGSWQNAQRILNDDVLKEIEAAQPYKPEEDGKSEQTQVNELVQSLTKKKDEQGKGEPSKVAPLTEDVEVPVEDFPDWENSSVFTLLATDPITDKWTRGLDYCLSKTEIQRAKKLLTTLIDNGFYFTHYNHIEKDGEDFGDITLTLYHLYGNKSKELRFFKKFNNFKHMMNKLNISLKSCNNSSKDVIPQYLLNSKFMSLLQEEEEKMKDKVQKK